MAGEGQGTRVAVAEAEAKRAATEEGEGETATGRGEAMGEETVVATRLPTPPTPNHPATPPVRLTMAGES